MATQQKYAEFLYPLSDLGCTLNIASLRDGARSLLKIIPPDTTTVANLMEICKANATAKSDGDQADTTSATLESVFFGSSQSQVLYNLEVSRDFVPL